MRGWWAVAIGMATLTTTCGGTATSPAALPGSASSHLLSIDQLVSPDFTVDTAPHQLSAADIAGGDQTVVAQLRSAGLLTGASEEFFRAAANLIDANGPVQVRDTVEAFSSASGAATVFAADAVRLDIVAGATAVSTGSLGDAAHATTRIAPAPSGATAIEVTVEWRVDNLVDLLVVRGRQGGTRLDDALVLAHRQTASELGLASAPPGS